MTYDYTIRRLAHNKYWLNRYKWMVSNGNLWYESGLAITIYGAKRAVRREAKKHNRRIRPNVIVDEGAVTVDV